MHSILNILLVIIWIFLSNSVFGANLVEWNTNKSMRLLSESRYKIDFFTLSNHFETQITKAYCGVASSVIVLNSLSPSIESIPTATYVLDESAEHYSSRLYFKRFTQKNILIGTPKHPKDINSMPDAGLQLQQLADLISSHGVSVTKRVITKQWSLEKMKRDMKQNLSNPNDYIIINYSRKVLGQKGGGHISPIGAYDADSDRFLIMDVNPNKVPWVWVKSKDLWNSMNTFDTIENRGYLLINQ